MIGLSVALAFNPPNAPTVDKVMESFSRKIERSFGDFDRATNDSLSKKQVQEITKMVYQRTDLADSKAREGNEIINTLLHGSRDEIKAIWGDGADPRDLQDIADKLEIGIKRLRYSFFQASTSPAWKPHMTTLKHLESRTIKSFSAYLYAVKELVELLPHYIESTVPVSFDIEDIDKALSEPMTEQPAWVNSGEDFAKWIKGMKD